MICLDTEKECPICYKIAKCFFGFDEFILCEGCIKKLIGTIRGNLPKKDKEFFKDYISVVILRGAFDFPTRIELYKNRDGTDCDGLSYYQKKIIKIFIPKIFSLYDFMATLEHEYHHITDPGLKHGEYAPRGYDENVLTRVSSLEQTWKTFMENNISMHR